MQYIIPHYYKKFVCIGGDCPDTCCAGDADYDRSRFAEKNTDR